ncbi:hypothetical protein ACP70R_032871 [Stipagrostis hirtigluma subsp. patula]
MLPPPRPGHGPIAGREPSDTYVQTQDSGWETVRDHGQPSSGATESGPCRCGRLGLSNPIASRLKSQAAVHPNFSCLLLSSSSLSPRKVSIQITVQSYQGTTDSENSESLISGARSRAIPLPRGKWMIKTRLNLRQHTLQSATLKEVSAKKNFTKEQLEARRRRDRANYAKKNPIAKRKRKDSQPSQVQEGN